MFDVPPAMKKNGRGEDQEFDGDEKLFRRFPPEYFFPRESGCKRIDFASLALPNMSVNRSKHGGEPRYVLYDLPAKAFRGDWGIFSLLIDQIPDVLRHHRDDYKAFARHKPLKKNYHHTEVQMSDPSGTQIVATDHFSYEVIMRLQQRLRVALKVLKTPNEVWIDENI